MKETPSMEDPNFKKTFAHILFQKPDDKDLKYEEVFQQELQAEAENPELTQNSIRMAKKHFSWLSPKRKFKLSLDKMNYEAVKREVPAYQEAFP